MNHYPRHIGDCPAILSTALCGDFAMGLANLGRSSRNDAKRLIRERHARHHGTHTDEQWRRLVRMFGGRCVRCGVDCNRRGGPIKDHVVPIYLGGSDRIDNIQPLCQSCNSGKGPDCTNYCAGRMLGEV